MLHRCFNKFLHPIRVPFSQHEKPNLKNCYIYAAHIYQFRAQVPLHLNAFQYSAANLYSPWNRRKFFGFLMISGGIKVCCRILESIEIRKNIGTKLVKLLGGNPAKWSNTAKQFFGKTWQIALSVFDHLVALAL